MASVVLSAPSPTDTLYANSVTVGGGGIDCLGTVTSAGAMALTGNLVLTAPSFVAPQTAVATAGLGCSGATNPAVVNLTINTSAPLTDPSGLALSSYSTTATAPAVIADSVTVARPGVASLPLLFPTGSQAGIGPAAAGRVQVAAADAIACPSITAASQVMAWLMGIPAAPALGGAPAVPTAAIPGAAPYAIGDFAPAIAAYSASPVILAPTITAITAGVGFTLNGTAGATYGYMVLYA